MSHPLLLDQIQHLLRIEFLHYDMPAADACHRMRGAPSVHVKQRNRVQLDVVVSDSKARHHLHCMKIQVSMSHHHALGICGGARRIEELRQVVVRQAGRREPGAGGGQKPLVIGTVRARFTGSRFQRDELLDRASLFADGFNYRNEVEVIEHSDRF